MSLINGFYYRMKTRKALFEQYVGESKEKKSKNALRAWAQLLATPLAKAILTRKSTVQSFVAGLEKEKKEKAERLLENITGEQAKTLFERRMKAV